MQTIKPELSINIYKRAITLWGVDKQRDVVAEEAAELIQALLKYRRNGFTEEWRVRVIEEAADVSIMLEQLVMMVGSDEEFRKAKAYKLNRLTKLIDCGTGNQTCENDDAVI